jgi:hypothetical protein
MERYARHDLLVEVTPSDQGEEMSGSGLLPVGWR